MDSNKQKIIETLRSVKISAKDVELFEFSVREAENNFRKKTRSQTPTSADRLRQYTL